jgi:hypothetical protein
VFYILYNIKMQFEDNPEAYKSLAHNGYRIRGYFLSEIIVLERLIDRFIARHFTDNENRQMELIELFLSTKRIIFENKKMAVKHIIDLHYSDKFPNWKQLYSDLSKLADLRNLIAHNILDTSPSGLEHAKNGTISFIKFENATIEVTYTKAEIDNFKGMVKGLQAAFYAFPPS